MSDKNTGASVPDTDKELSIDELKDVSGGMTYREDGANRAKKRSKSIPEDGILSSDDAADLVIDGLDRMAPGYDIHDYERGHR